MRIRKKIPKKRTKISQLQYQSIMIFKYFYHEKTKIKNMKSGFIFKLLRALELSSFRDSFLLF